MMSGTHKFEIPVIKLECEGSSNSFWPYRRSKSYHGFSRSKRKKRYNVLLLFYLLSLLLVLKVLFVAMFTYSNNHSDVCCKAIGLMDKRDICT